MTPDQIGLVQGSWAQVKPIADQAASLFYGRLFEIAPEVKPLFKGDMAKQGKLLMTMIDTAVAGLSRLDLIIGAVSDLGRRHSGYGVREEHYAIVGEALLWTLDKGLGPAFTPDVRNAWASAYGTLSATMIAATK
jgi:nitric oxide dioxygenase